MKLLENFGIQMWSVRDVAANDFAGTLKKLSDMGYTGVEFAGYGGLNAQEMKAALLNMKPIGAHISLDRLTNNLDEEIEYHKFLGTEYLICPHSTIKIKDEAVQLAHTLTPVIEKINKAGFKFAYHNHAHEFHKCCGDYLLDSLFANLPGEAAMELDVFWTCHAGVEPVAYMEKHRDRLKLIHVKQIDSDKNCVDIDKGIIDYKDVIIKAQGFGAQHFILEQEKYEISSMVSVKNGIDYIFTLEK